MQCRLLPQACRFETPRPISSREFQRDQARSSRASDSVGHSGCETPIPAEPKNHGRPTGWRGIETAKGSRRRNPPAHPFGGYPNRPACQLTSGPATRQAVAATDWQVLPRGTANRHCAGQIMLALIYLLRHGRLEVGTTQLPQAQRNGGHDRRQRGDQHHDTPRVNRHNQTP